MHYLLERVRSGPNATIGILYRMVGSARQFECFTLEDEYRKVKLSGETRIPSGQYEVKLRNAGGMTKRYAQRFPDLHRGMLHLQNVPGFEWIYFHTGLHEGHTAGCVLVGLGVSTTVGARLSDTVPAYRRIYRDMAGQLDAGGRVTVTIRDIA